MPLSGLWMLVVSLQLLLFSLQRLVDSRPRLRARLGRGVDPPHLQLLLLLLPRVAGGEVFSRLCALEEVRPDMSLSFIHDP